MTVRSYRLRRGRLSTSTAEALDRMGALLVPVDGRPLDVPALFGRTAPLVVEIGSGMGEATAAMAAADPGRDLLAVDVHVQGLGRLLRRVEEEGLTNVRVAEGDAVVLLRDMLGVVDEVRVFFPDPWPKARHVKRRLVSAAFADLVASRLRPRGLLHVATDWAAYADQVREVLTAHPAYEVVHSGERWSRPVTRFEQRGLDAGRPSYDLVVRRRGGTA
ncbi:MAG: tRNA (guanosine(46)-N7)-methyltransferase TrmB [Actinobacteria bacterium]|nr:tRNA (guanosine(46)-N7)-methyltransferase TrmB [Actinomycetota bacterium]MCA1721149.1 tRNA (guanosine(46)-N7)-methyltransferase TrmB [Actinomycetota bacterium]